jgi:hypothetical protein
MKPVLPEPDHKTNGDRRKAIAKPSIPFAETRYKKYRFERESILLHAPECSGVYGLYSALWICLGEADNLRTRLLELVNGDHPCIIRYKPSGFAFELASPLDRLGRCQQLVTELLPLCIEKASAYRRVGPGSR